MSAAAIEKAADELMANYADCIDDGRFDDWLELFTEDASYKVVARDNHDRGLPATMVLCTNKNMIRDRIAALLGATKYNFHYDRHVVGQLRVRPRSDDEWELRASYAVFQTSDEGRSSLFSVGRYDDRIRRQGDRLLFCAKTVVVDTFAIPGMLATPL
ncbi:MAG TPA: aromatic-ring-hydroxylating dioxygenase subunit beta [Caldimonas sp.]|jgi:anthranilate 1,2-dioxygenase small subunit|nr:aromatic-ring-hydroxylating dioxygenase subunit beta [Caldimonas sp.]